MERKTLEQLTMKNSFLFAAVMMDPENCRLVLEHVLEMEIESVEVNAEKSMAYHPEYKGVRLDIYAKDENRTCYNIEMQVATEKILKRARYYHSQIDMHLLPTGEDYVDLPKAFVIFICDFDPIGLKKYRYTRKCVLKEEESYTYDDGTYTVFLSTKGNNDQEEPEELIKFLKYVGAEQEDSTKDYNSELVKRLQESVKKIKQDKDMRDRYMLFEEMLRKEYKQGKIEAEEKAIRNIIEVVKATGGTKEDAVRIVIEKYPEYADRAKELVDRYWE